MLQPPRAGAIRPPAGPARSDRAGKIAMLLPQPKMAIGKPAHGGGQGPNRPSQSRAPVAAGIAAMRLVLGRAMTQPPPMGSQPLAKARAAAACRWFRAGTALPPPRG